MIFQDANQLRQIIGGATYCAGGVASVQHVRTGQVFRNRIKRWGIRSCPLCRDLAMKMDEWGAEGCAERREKILDEVESNTQAHPDLWVKLLRRATTSDGRRAIVSKWLDEAIEETHI